MAEAKIFVFLGSASDAFTSFRFFRLVEGVELFLYDRPLLKEEPSRQILKALEWSEVETEVYGPRHPRPLPAELSGF